MWIFTKENVAESASTVEFARSPVIRGEPSKTKIKSITPGKDTEAYNVLLFRIEVMLVQLGKHRSAQVNEE